MLLDIHSHILPNVDDGAKNIEESISLLSVMHSQGISDVIATPHFYPHLDNLENFKQKTTQAFDLLSEKINGKDFPNIYLGCEILYYSGISKVDAIKNFTLNNSKYILLELNPYLITRTLQSELLYLRDTVGLIPIIPHIERYYKARGYKKFLEFVKENNILTQVNATSFFSKRYHKPLEKLITENIATFIGTDSHSIEKRPPLMKLALEYIKNTFGDEYKTRLIENNNSLFKQIIAKEPALYDFK